MNIVGTGLIVIAIGWLVQLYFLFKGRKEIQPLFIIIYMVGVLLLVVSGFMKAGIMGAKFELATLIAAAIVLVKVLIGR